LFKKTFGFFERQPKVFLKGRAVISWFLPKAEPYPNLWFYPLQSPFGAGAPTLWFFGRIAWATGSFAA